MSPIEREKEEEDEESSFVWDKQKKGQQKKPEKRRRRSLTSEAAFGVDQTPVESQPLKQRLERELRVK